MKKVDLSDIKIHIIHKNFSYQLPINFIYENKEKYKIVVQYEKLDKSDEKKIKELISEFHNIKEEINCLDFMYYKDLLDIYIEENKENLKATKIFFRYIGQIEQKKRFDLYMPFKYTIKNYCEDDEIFQYFNNIYFKYYKNNNFIFYYVYEINSKIEKITDFEDYFKTIYTSNLSLAPTEDENIFYFINFDSLFNRHNNFRRYKEAKEITKDNAQVKKFRKKYDCKSKKKFYWKSNE